MSNRREFIKSFVAGGAVACAADVLLAGRAAARARLLSPLVAPDDPWAQVPVILRRIKPPVFPKRDFPITRYGAVGDGQCDCTEAFRKAIAACNKAGGGRVVVPAGAFLTGP